MRVICNHLYVNYYYTEPEVVLLKINIIFYVGMRKMLLRFEIYVFYFLYRYKYYMNMNGKKNNYEHNNFHVKLS